MLSNRGDSFAICRARARQGNRIKTEVILRRSDARWAQAAGIAQPKNPVSYQRNAPTVHPFMHRPDFHGILHSASAPRLRPRRCSAQDDPLFLMRLPCKGGCAELRPYFPVANEKAGCLVASGLRDFLISPPSSVGGQWGYASSALIAEPLRVIITGRPLGVLYSLCGSMPSAVKNVAAMSSGEMP